MTCFSRPLLPPDRLRDEPILRAFAAFFVIGAALRAVACFSTVGIIHPDEHQQYLEQAHRHVFGYGQLFWEQVQGVRHPLYPALNGLGAMLILVSLHFAFNMASFVIELFWLAISAFGLYRALKARAK